MKSRNTSRKPLAVRAGLLLAAVTLLALGSAPAAAQGERPAEAFQDIPSGIRPEQANQAAAAQAAPDQAAFDYAAVDLRIGVWTDRTGDEVYRKGETMTVGFQTNADAYAVVYRIGTEGEVTVLWPRSRLDDGFVFGGHEYVLPVSGARQLEVSFAEGEGFVQAVVSRYPFDLRALELDFHHDRTGEVFDFRVVGDPFLAMNEVNYAITGLEDTEDYVVTNYASYYVHRAVEHPRYLCNQCHFEDGWTADPYDTQCRLDITVDYRWSNGWWSTYGYYPVYYYPSYVYVDPWYGYPWVNYWYNPWWYGPTVSVCYWPSYAYPWYDSPYYGGNYTTGPARYRPLSPGPAGDGTRSKVREYGPLSPMVAAAGASPARGEAARGTTAVRGKGARGEQAAWRGEARADRTRPVIDADVRTRGTAGLRIRDGGTVRGGESGGTARVRHTAGDSRSPSAVVPVTGGATGGGRRDVRSGAGSGTTQRVGEERGARSRGGEADSRTIKPVEPRQKGTRIWNTGRAGSSDGGRRPEQVRPGGRSGGSDSGRGGSVRPGSSSDGKTTGGGDTRTRSGGTRDGGTRDSGVRDGGATRGGGTRDSGVRDGGSRSGGSDARSSGGSRDSGVRDGGSRSGGSDARSSGGGGRPSAPTGGGSRGGSRADGGGRGGR